MGGAICSGLKNLPSDGRFFYAKKNEARPKSCFVIFVTFDYATEEPSSFAETTSEGVSERLLL